MLASRLADTVPNLYGANTPAAFWQLLIEPRVSQDEWTNAMQVAASILPFEGALRYEDPNHMVSSILGEEIFGLNHWTLSRSKRLYYKLKPFIPRQLGIFLRQHYRHKQETHFALNWPIEDRYVRFQFNCVQNVLHQRKLDELSYVNFWPHNHRFAFTITHDIETKQGFDFVHTVADMEERLGFRSSFNVVPERYPIDHQLLAELRKRGFEIGVHGLKHDGELFSSLRIFEPSAQKINGYLRQWEAVGFRAPYMHRNPEWLQALNVEYDLSFFDTDPYEPMPGGTMSIWPFSLGSFIELPYTLVQDHTLMAIHGAKTPRLWLDKVDFIEHWRGLALVNVHPDYLREPEHLAIYQDFLLAMKERENCWHALPREVARWWKLRSEFQTPQHDGEWDLSSLPGATVSQLSVHSDTPMIPSRLSSQLKESQGYAGISSAASINTPHTPRSIGAVVVGGDFQGLGIARSLGRWGVPVCIIDDEFSISRFSRYVTHAVRVADLRDEQQTVNGILEVGKRLGLEGWVLYPTREETVAAFSHQRTKLSEWFRVPTPEWNTVQWAWDKRNTYRLAQELGIPTPKTWYPQGPAELDQIEADRPLTIKPAIKEHFIYATKAKAWRANNRDELVELYRRATTLVGPSEAMIQEFIPGDGQQQFAYCAFFKDGQAIGSMVVQRTRQHPPDFGRASTFVQTVNLPLLETYSERFLKKIDYYGLVEIEYKLDPRDGQYKLLDFNARTWGYHTLGQRAGVDFPTMLFADQLGEQVEACKAQVGMKWIRLLTDVPTSVKEILAGQLDWRTYLQSLKDIHIESVFNREDPLPGLAELALVPYLLIKRGF